MFIGPAFIYLITGIHKTTVGLFNLKAFTFIKILITLKYLCHISLERIISHINFPLNNAVCGRLNLQTEIRGYDDIKKKCISKSIINKKTQGIDRRNKKPNKYMVIYVLQLVFS